MPIIFISHSVADKPVIDDLFDLLQTGCDLRRKDIFCSSVEGAGIQTGEDFIEWIQGKLETSNLIILFLTENYYASRFCVAEMGAAWSLRKDVFPLVVPGIDRDPGAVLLGSQTARVDETGLDHLRDAISKHYSKASGSTARWSIKKEEFLKLFREKLPSLPTPPLVHRDRLKAEKERADEALKIMRESDAENRQLREKTALLEKAKDAEEVAEIRAKYSTEDEHYDNFVNKLSQLLEDLSNVEKRCIYASIASQPWNPVDDEFKYYQDEIERLDQRAWITYDSDPSSEGFNANADHPRYEAILQTFDDFDKFLDKAISTRAFAQIQDARTFYIDIKNREFWEEELGCHLI